MTVLTIFIFFQKLKNVYTHVGIPSCIKFFFFLRALYYYTITSNIRVRCAGQSKNDGVGGIVNNSFERAIKEDSLSESSTKSTTSLSITVWKTGRWAGGCRRGAAGFETREKSAPRRRP